MEQASQTQRQLLAPLVGARFRPPAALILECLARGAELTIEPEPTNPYDEFALRVHVRVAAIPESQFARLEVELPGFGHTLDGLRDADSVFLGYIASSDTAAGQKAIAANPGTVGNRQVGEALAAADGLHVAVLEFAPTGLPLVAVRVGGPT